MKKLFAVLLALVLLLGCVPLGALAAGADVTARAFREVLRDAALPMSYIKTPPVVFYDLCGDEAPEMILLCRNGQSGEEVQVWGVENGGAKQLLSLTWYEVSNARHYLYLMKDGGLAWHYINSGYDAEHVTWTREGHTYTPAGSGFSASGSYDFLYREYQDGSQSYGSGRVNGEAAGESAAWAADKALLDGAALLLMDNLGSSCRGMSRADALAWLYTLTGSFFDVPADAYYADPVAWAVERGVTNGMTEASFGPDENCTRAHVVTFLWRAAGSPEPGTAASPFSDVQDPGQYYYKAVLWAAENGVTTGVDGSHFAPDSTCTRGQVVTFLWRAAGKPAPKTARSPFADVADAGAYYYPAVLWAFENGVTTGVSGTLFDPAGICKRAHVVTFLYRADSLEPQTETGWSEAYRHFVVDHAFLSAGQEYSMGQNSSFSDFLVTLYDLDDDGTPELLITNGESGRAVRMAYVYTCVDGQAAYLGIGPTDACVDPEEPQGLIGVYRDGGYMSLTRYEKTGEGLSTRRIAEYEGFAGDSAARVHRLTYLTWTSVTRIEAEGWTAFVSGGTEQ